MTDNTDLPPDAVVLSEDGNERTFAFPIADGWQLNAEQRLDGKWSPYWYEGEPNESIYLTTPEILRLPPVAAAIAEAVKAEREACAKVCEDVAECSWPAGAGFEALEEASEEIRARSNEPKGNDDE